jgi:hypothetical protein
MFVMDKRHTNLLHFGVANACLARSQKIHHRKCEFFNVTFFMALYERLKIVACGCDVTTRFAWCWVHVENRLA